jgi:asparagine synthase (glutamine-hydrolysing)
MCGLVGNTYGQDVDEELEAIAHRGPDDRGVYRDGDLTLGHVRLAIRDLSGSRQPFRHGETVVTYNGELWDVEGPSDTAALAAALDEFGTEVLEDLRGQFAVAWTSPAGTFLARDRYGEVTLYVERVRAGWRWASERRVLGPGARPLPAGHVLDVSSGTLTRWARRPAVVPPVDPASVREELSAAVARRLVADVPVALLLSGGLDSSAIVANARDHLDRAVAYTAVFDPCAEDAVAARKVAQEFGIPLVEVPVSRPTLETVRRAVETIETPMKAQVEIALLCMPLAERIAADGFRVVLTGEAADEVYGGYGNLIRHSGSDSRWREVRTAAVDKMARGNFVRISKVFLRYGVEARTPFADPNLVEPALAAGRDTCPPGKRVLVDAVDGLVPDFVRHRDKATFQGSSGISAACADQFPSPIKLYNAEARKLFGVLPKG